MSRRATETGISSTPFCPIIHFIELALSKVTDAFKVVINQCLYVSEVYPRDLFEAHPVGGSFHYFQTRHPDLYSYIGRLAEALKVMAGKGILQSFSIRVGYEQVPICEWVFELGLADVRTVDSQLLMSWIGSCAVKMIYAYAKPLVMESEEKTFSLMAKLKSQLSSYRFGSENDWVLSDSDPAFDAATVIPCKSFHTSQMKFNAYLKVFRL